jgi:hypothetical protein
MNFPFSPLDFFKSLTFGGLIFSGIGAALYLIFPHFFAGLIGIKLFCGFMGLLGAGLQRGITNIYRTFFPPVGKFVSHYEKVIEASLLLKMGYISEAKYYEIIDTLTSQRFLLSLPKTPVDKNLLPPSSQQ